MAAPENVPHTSTSEELLERLELPSLFVDMIRQNSQVMVSVQQKVLDDVFQGPVREFFHELGKDEEMALEFQSCCLLTAELSLYSSIDFEVCRLIFFRVLLVNLLVAAVPQRILDKNRQNVCRRHC